MFFLLVFSHAKLSVCHNGMNWCPDFISGCTKVQDSEGLLKLNTESKKSNVVHLL